MIQKRTILEVGSFPYSIDTNRQEYQRIPVEELGPTILYVIVVPPTGPYGTADGIYFLFKPGDTLLIDMDNENKPLITHISSAKRTKELSFAKKHMNFVGIAPLYTFFRNKNRFELFKQVWGYDFKKREKMLDSLYRPYINTAESFCINNSIDPEIGRWFYNFYLGSMIRDKLFSDHKIDPTHQRQLVNFYKDSLAKWMIQLNCSDCGNIQSYNLALEKVYRFRFNNLTPHVYMDTVAVLTKGNNRNFLLSSFMLHRLEKDKDPEALLKHYDRLCKDSIFTRLVHNNYMLRKSTVRPGGNELAILMRGDKSETGFNRLLSTLKGKTVYIDFWASWCKPCIDEIEFSHSLKEKVTNKNVVMIYISIDTDFGSWVQAREKYKLNDENSFILIDPEKNALSKKINLGAIPRYLIVDKTGKIVRLNAGKPSEEATYKTLLKLANE